MTLLSKLALGNPPEQLGFPFRGGTTQNLGRSPLLPAATSPILRCIRTKRGGQIKTKTKKASGLGPVLPEHRPRCCWLARATRCCWSTGRLSRATRSRPTWCTRPASPRWSDGACSTGVVATGCPPIDTMRSTSALHDRRPPGADGGVGVRPAPHGARQAAGRRGVEAAPRSREGFTVEGCLIEDGRVVGIRGRQGRRDRHRDGRVVVGADGRHSSVARLVGPSSTTRSRRCSAATTPTGAACRWTALRGLHPPGRQAWRPGPTNDDLTLVIAGWPFDEFEANKRDIEGNFSRRSTWRRAFAERLAAARREERFVGTAMPNYFRKPYGPGWALVGDAGYHKDFITAQGISDAFRDAELCATALDECSQAARSFDAAMADYQTARDRQVLPMYEFTTELVTLGPPPPRPPGVVAPLPGHPGGEGGLGGGHPRGASPPYFLRPRDPREVHLPPRGDRRPLTPLYLNLPPFLPSSSPRGSPARAWVYDLTGGLLGRRGNRMRAMLADDLQLQPGDQVLDGLRGPAASRWSSQSVWELPARSTASIQQPEMIKRASSRARKRGLPATFQVAFAQDPPFADGTFDAVACTLALHHVAEDAN